MRSGIAKVKIGDSEVALERIWACLDSRAHCVAAGKYGGWVWPRLADLEVGEAVCIVL